MMLRNQLSADGVYFRIAGGVGQAKHSVGIVEARGEPSSIEGLADQQAQQRAQQRCSTHQRQARDDADELALPALRFGLLVH